MVNGVQGQVQKPVGGVGGPGIAVAGAGKMAGGMQQEPAKKSKWWVWVIVVLVIIAITVGIWFWLSP